MVGRTLLTSGQVINCTALTSAFCSQVWEQFLSEDRDRALSLDALNTSHAIAVDVKRPSEIGQLFDAISYSKGARFVVLCLMVVERVKCIDRISGLKF